MAKKRKWSEPHFKKVTPEEQREYEKKWGKPEVTIKNKDNEHGNNDNVLKNK